MRPNPRLLTLLLVFIVSTLFGSWARPLGTPMVVLAGLFGAAVGWVAARWMMRRIF